MLTGLAPARPAHAVPRMIKHVVIVGGGFSGTLQAINLLRHGDVRVTLIERSAVPGRGLAYGAAHPSHLLNVHAGNMSAFPDDAGHFARWLHGRGVADAASTYAPRLTYGAYIGELLDTALEGNAGRFAILRDDVEDVITHDGGARVRMRSTTIDADVAVLAIGNLPPHTPVAISPNQLADGRYVADPWDPSALDGLTTEDTVLALGTGLTMIDIVLALDSRGFAGRIVALSRRGLVPRVHAPSPPLDEPLCERPRHTGSQLVRAVRKRARTIGWRRAVDELRPFTQDMWAAADPAARERFLRHLRPWWDVHRHRLAPEIDGRLAALQMTGQLVIHAGKLCQIEERGDVAIASWRPRGGDPSRNLPIQRIINCTGPLGDVSRTAEPLLRRLSARGTIRADSACLGIDVNPSAQTIDAEGNANPWLAAVGPMTRGAFWEIIAVPDIRFQTWTLSRRLTNAHWVEAAGL